MIENKLLLLRTNQCLPCGVFSKQDCYARRWWRQVQYLATVFWKRWLREYLPMLQTRPKWNGNKIDVNPGDLVLVVEENLPRGQWPLGRVLHTCEGRDGVVRSCKIKCAHTTKVRPLTKLCLLEQPQDTIG